MRPETGTYPKYLENYIDKVSESTLKEALKANSAFLLETLALVHTEQQDYAYAEGKWTIKQLLLHISDAERIFAYRALRFVRGDEQQPLSFDEDMYAANSNAHKRTLKSVIEELIAVRNATAPLIDQLEAEDFVKTGNTAIGKITVNALGFAICGHCQHHLQILKERYL